MQCSIFAPFGHFRFSRKAPIAKTLYDGLRAGLGGESMLGEDTLAGDLHAKLFATAMVCAGAQRCVDRVNDEANPAHARELLDGHLADYRATPATSATADDKRDLLAAALLTAQGNAPTIVDAAIADLLGSRLIGVRRFGYAEAVMSPTDWDSTGPGLWKHPATIGKTHKLAADVWPGASVVTVTTFDGAEFVGGEEVLVEPMRLGLEERVTLSDDGTGVLSATFIRHHPTGAVITSQPWPRASSTARHLLIVVDSETAVSAEWRKRVAVLRKMLRSTDRWSLVDETAAGIIGPFVPDAGIPGVTPLVQTTTANP